MTRSIDITLGAMTSAIAPIGLGFALFGPASYSYGTNWIEASSQRLWNEGIGTTAVMLFLATMIVAALGPSVSTYVRSRGGTAPALALLWASAVLLLVGAAVTLPGQNAVVVPSQLHTDTPDSVSIGIYLIPAIGMAFLTALSATMTHSTARPLEPLKLGDMP